MHGVHALRLAAEELNMSRVQIIETEVEAEIEWLQLEARDIRRRLERATSAEDRRTLDCQLKELEIQIEERRRS